MFSWVSDKWHWNSVKGDKGWKLLKIQHNSGLLIYGFYFNTCLILFSVKAGEDGMQR